MELEKNILDWTFEKLRIQPVGNGKVDCICPYENVGVFIDAMNKFEVKITGLTWLCFVDSDHKSCDTDKLKNTYGSGWYNEIPANTTKSFSCNEEVRKYLLHEYPNSEERNDCYQPGFLLSMAKE